MLTLHASALAGTFAAEQFATVLAATFVAADDLGLLFRHISSESAIRKRLQGHFWP